MTMNIPQLFEQYRVWSQGNYLIEETNANERDKYNEFKAADYDNDRAVSLYEYLDYLQHTKPEIKIEFKYLALAWDLNNLQMFSNYYRPEAEKWRAAGARQMAEIKDPLALPALYVAVNDEDSEVSREAFNAIGEIGEISSINFLKPFLTNPNQSRRVFAQLAFNKLIAKNYQKMGNELTQYQIQMLKACTQNQYVPEVCESVLNSLDQTGVSDFLLPTIMEIASDQKNKQRHEFFALLKNISYKISATYLDRGLTDENSKIRAVALGIIAIHSDTDSYKKVLSSLQDKDPEIRKAALLYLEKHSQEINLELFVHHALNDPSEEVRVLAIRVLGDLGRENEAAKLQLIISQDQSSWVKARAQDAWLNIYKRLKPKSIF